MAPARQQQTPQFNKDEKVLCFHMDMLYEAKVMDVQPGEKPGDGFRYKVHYKGWKNTWDDWVLADRIRPFDDEHKELAAQLHAQVKSSMQKNSKQPKKNLKGGDSARGSEERGSGAPQGGRGGRRGKDWELEQAPKPPKVGRGVNTTKASNTAKAPKVNKVNKITKITKVSKKVSKDNGKGKGCKSARAKKLPSTARPPREHARQTFPLSNVRGCPHAEDDAEHADAATIAPAPRPDPPATPPGSRRSNIASKIKRLRMAPDHLLQFPQVNHRYLSAQGRILFDNRYEVHLSPPADSPKRLPRHTKAAPKATHAVAQAGSEDAFHSKPMINLPVPDHIQAMLVDDWENITKNNQLVPLPHPKPVTRILEDYLSFERPHREEGSASMDILDEVVAGFREYFEKALSRILLYRFERHQYMDLRKLWDNVESTKYKSVCDVYGAEHLSRLLAQTNMDQQSVSRLREEIGKFTVWLGRHCETYFVNEYETPSQEYVDKARSF
ncbi:hypothetical protein H633G_04967 [Metarhizium anisopliae BRIP 53284]|nr:hypothetical protein H633G_04967 [Metarhizium anisopliae BRIP 53284]